MAHREEEVPSLKAVRADVPDELDAVFRKMMAKRPDDRYQSAGELADALEVCVRKESVAVVGDEPSDGALTSFLKNLEQQAVPQKPGTPAAEETMPSRAVVDTERSHWKKAVPGGRRPVPILPAVVAASVLLVVVLAGCSL